MAESEPHASGLTPHAPAAPPRRDYSQRGEQAVLLDLLKRTPEHHRTLIDVGAYHPETFSNTRALVEDGWRAVMVEPDPWAVTSLIDFYGEDHPRVSVVLAACVAEAPDLEAQRLVTMRFDRGGALSTTCEAHRVLWQRRATFTAPVRVATVPLAALLGMHRPWFVNIDVEGGNAPLLRVATARADVHAVCVERDHQTDAMAQEFNRALLEAVDKRGFRVVAEFDENVILERQ